MLVTVSPYSNLLSSKYKILARSYEWSKSTGSPEGSKFTMRLQVWDPECFHPAFCACTLPWHDISCLLTLQKEVDVSTDLKFASHNCLLQGAPVNVRRKPSRAMASVLHDLEWGAGQAVRHTILLGIQVLGPKVPQVLSYMALLTYTWSHQTIYTYKICLATVLWILMLCIKLALAG